MLFNSFEFIFFFLPIVIIGFKLSSNYSVRASVWWLAISSVAFYSVWNWRFTPLLLGSICVNYCSAVLIQKLREKERIQYWCLVSTVALNILALCYCKYLFPTLNFFADRGLFSQFQNVVLPLGISFFTFTQIAYLIDLKQGEAELEPFRNYLFFVTFFPHLIAGPILHHHEIMPQLADPKKFRLNYADMSAGIALFVIGLVKKVVFADKIAVFVPQLFDNPRDASLLSAWPGVLSYAIQLYFDFSGYSDMAVGLAQMFSIRFPLNFNSPYKAGSIIEFWQRWHMTLTRYITVYLYNPMSLKIMRRTAVKGKRFSPKGKLTFNAFALRIGFPTVATMFLAGIWHGSGLQFIVFGVLHGIYLSINHAWRMFGSPIKKWADPATSRFPMFFSATSVLTVFLAVILGQVFFRAKSCDDAWEITSALLGVHGIKNAFTTIDHTQLIYIVGLLFVIWFLPNSQQIVGYSQDLTTRGEVRSQLQPGPRIRWQPSLVWAAIAALVFTYALVSVGNKSEFLYFQF